MCKIHTKKKPVNNIEKHRRVKPIGRQTVVGEENFNS
jgi:hypothetical protein